MNPNQRGVELPPGCKDLMDVLKMQPVAEGPIGREQLKQRGKKSDSPENTQRIEIGRMKDIEPWVERFVEHKKSPRVK